MVNQALGTAKESLTTRMFRDSNESSLHKWGITEEDIKGVAGAIHAGGIETVGPAGS
jgi:hypothetical protein